MNIKYILDILNIIVLFFILCKIKNFDKRDKILSLLIILTIIIYAIGRFKNSTKTISFFHLCWVFLMIIIPLITKNKFLLFIYSVIILITITSRKILGSCMIRKLENNKSKFTNNKISKFINPYWDYIFAILGIVSNYKLYKLSYD